MSLQRLAFSLAGNPPGLAGTIALGLGRGRCHTEEIWKDLWAPHRTLAAELHNLRVIDTATKSLRGIVCWKGVGNPLVK